jgi:hypothetical protein
MMRLICFAGLCINPVWIETISDTEKGCEVDMVHRSAIVLDGVRCSEVVEAFNESGRRWRYE